MSIALLDRDSLKYPEYFWSELEKSNAQKEKDAPVAVILQAIADDRNALDGTPSQSQILQIAKTHRVALKSIDAGHLVGPKIREIAQTTGKSPKLLMINAHGGPNSVTFGKMHGYHRLFFKNRHVYHESDIKAQDFSDLAPDAQIHLSCCETGKFLAQRIANIANRSVFAPTEKLNIHYTCLLEKPNHQFRMFSYDDRGFQHINEFNPDKKPIAFPDTFDSAKKRSAFATMVNYAKRHVSKGNPECQFTMGTFYSDGMIEGLGGLEESDKEAVKWYRLAADQGHPRAQSMLGVFYEKGSGGLEKSDKEAVKWFRLAADQGFSLAQNNLGEFYLEGRGGLPRSEKIALKWFRLAADQGRAEASSKITELLNLSGGSHHHSPSPQYK